MQVLPLLTLTGTILWPKSSIDDCCNWEHRPLCPWHWEMTNMTWGGQRESMNGDDCYSPHYSSSLFLPPPSSSLLPPPSSLLLPPSSSLLPSPDAVIDPWLQQLWEKLLSLYPLPPGMEPISDSVLYPQLKSHDLQIRSQERIIFRRSDL